MHASDRDKLTHITLRELGDLLRELDLPEDTRISLTIEEADIAETSRKLRAKRALQRLRSYGTG